MAKKQSGNKDQGTKGEKPASNAPVAPQGPKSSKEANKQVLEYGQKLLNQYKEKGVDTSKGVGGMGLVGAQAKALSYAMQWQQYENDKKTFKKEEKEKKDKADKKAAEQASKGAPITVGAQFLSMSNNEIADLLKDNPGNKVLQSAIADLKLGNAKAASKYGLQFQMKSGLAAQQFEYDTAKAKDAFEYTKELTAQEGQIQKDLQGMQLEGVKYGSDKELEGTKYSADQSAGAIKYGADKELEGVKYGYDSQEKQIGLKGEEERKTQLTLRADARGAISGYGKKFYA